MSIIWVALWLVWASLLYGGMIFGKGNAAKTHRCPTWARMGSSLTLVISAWLAYATSDLSVYPVWLALGMTLGFIGDLFMAKLILKNENFLLFGMSAFGIGHLFYIQAGAWHAGIWLTVWLVVAISAFLFTIRNAPDRNLLNWLAIPYSVLLGTTVASFFSLAVQTTQGNAPYYIMSVGALLFLISDAILALELFRKVHFNWIGDAVWWTYGTGQMLIIFTLIALAV